MGLLFLHDFNSKGGIYTSNVKYIVRRGQPYLWVPENDLHNVNTIIDERGSFAVTSPFPGPLGVLLKSLKKLPGQIALSGDVLPLKEDKSLAEKLQDVILSEQKAIKEFTYTVSGVLSSSYSSTSRSDSLQDLLGDNEKYTIYRFKTRHVQTVGNLLERVIQVHVAQLRGINTCFCLCHSTVSTCNELPRKPYKSERKPLVTSFNELKREARLKKKERQKVHEIILQPPENGLLVEHLVPIAREVYAARYELLSSVSRLVNYNVIYTCSLCAEVHVGHPPHKIKTCNVRGSPSNKEHSWVKGGVEHVLPLVESFHLYDRIGRAVSHNEMLEVDRIPAIVELCIQAGFDIPEYPTRRRSFPVYCVAGRIIDFEKRFPKGISLGEDIDAHGFWCKKKRLDEDTNSMAMQCDDVQAIAVQGMKAWEKMLTGASKLMEKYAVQTCGYCPEVQVGPKGHRVRNCQAFKHQMRDGQHAWQEATINDLAPPVYVYHIRDQQPRKPLLNELKRYYGMLPAVVELFAQAGAPVEKSYACMMREDVVIPEMDEEKWVV